MYVLIYMNNVVMFCWSSMSCSRSSMPCALSSMPCGPSFMSYGRSVDIVFRRVVAKRLDVSMTAVSEVMTPHPTMAHMDDSALDCLGIMIEKHFRHLPVSEQSMFLYYQSWSLNSRHGFPLWEGAMVSSMTYKTGVAVRFYLLSVC